MAARNPRKNSSGIGVDFQGAPVIDPTENVIALIQAESKRQDDLRDLNNKYLEARIKCLEETLVRQDQHAKEIRELETSRINAVRQVDVLAGQTTAAQANVAIQTLASTTLATAESLRNTMTTTAQTLAAGSAAAMAELSKRVGGLEQAIAVGAGKQLVADPMMTELLTEVKSLRQGGARGVGREEGSARTTAFLFALGALLVAVLGVGIVIVSKL